MTSGLFLTDLEQINYFFIVRADIHVHAKQNIIWTQLRIRMRNNFENMYMHIPEKLKQSVP